jgi:DNA-directed RNA polymerase subunit RPC12/RpoP
MFELLDIVRVKKEYPELSLTSNNIGTVVDIHNGGEAYTVEFIDENGDTIEQALYTDFTESELEYVPTKLDGGSSQERIKEMKKFFGLKPEQSFQDIDVDDNDYIWRDRKADILQWVKSMSYEEIAEQFELRERRYSCDYKEAVEDAKRMRNMTDEEFQEHLEYLAFREKESNPDKIVLCPRCGNRLIYKENGNSHTIRCVTEGCIKETCRGI